MAVGSREEDGPRKLGKVITLASSRHGLRVLLAGLRVGLLRRWKMCICFFISSDTILLSTPVVVAVVVRSVERCERVVGAEVKVGPLSLGYSSPTPAPVVEEG